METTIFAKLSKIQVELKAPKGQFNSFGKYKYRSCEDIVESVKPLLSKHGCSLTITDNVVLIGERYYINASAILTDVETGNNVIVDGFAREEETKKGMDGSQVTGASSSYARKYALNGLFAIDDTKDSDTTNTHGKDKADGEPSEKEIKKIENEKVNLNHIASVRNELDRTGVAEEKILESCGISDLKEMTFIQWTKTMSRLEKTETKKAK